METDVRDHAKNHVATKLADALDALTKDKADQDVVKKAIDHATPDGASSPYYGNVTASGTKYIWADFETDEGEGPVQTGTTFLFDAKGTRILSRDWTSSHDY